MAKNNNTNINLFFERFLKKESKIFTQKNFLQPAYAPDTVPHREEQIKQIAEILAPALKLEKPSNLFLYGKTGSGKTLSTIHTTNQLYSIASREKIPIIPIYINCKLKKVADTEYRLVAQLIRALGKEVPSTGLPTDEIYKIFFNIMEQKEQMLLLVLDEIDQLVKKAGDGILYNLTRMNTELNKSQISIIGISNDLLFTDNLDPRIKSSLSEEEIFFPSYNALQLQDILRERAKKAFKQGAIEAGVIEKCAAYAAGEHGDARRAVELLRVAGEIAERKDEASLKIEHIDEAQDKIDHDRIIDIVKTQPKQFQLSLYSIVSVCLNRKDLVFTGEVYDLYKKLCSRIGLRPLTQRRMSDIIAELDMLGVISTKVISKGRYGRTREISLSIPPTTQPKIKKILEEELELA
ncbi:MAG: ORC1-type DNA replication protein [Candidatus Woesearchaeota archaeon]|nr:ORC1-type DNA replication protein [Candidatus Woesearchaeota archaeon]